MNTFDNLFSRRSIRNFNCEYVTEEELKPVLRAAQAAPVGFGRYDWLHLTVIRNRNFLDNLDFIAAEAFLQPESNPLYGASVLILVSSRFSKPSMHNIYYSNAAITAQNMVTAAVELGLGACHIWGAVGVLNSKPEMLAELNLPEGMVPCCAVALGHTDEVYTIRDIPEDRIETTYFE